MRIPFVVTDLTRMSSSGVCLAGYEYWPERTGRCLRPLLSFEKIDETWLFNKTGIIRPFAVVEIDVSHERPEPPHTEDVVIERRFRMLHPGIDDMRRTALMSATAKSSVAEIFGTQIHHDNGWFVARTEGGHSIGTILPQSIDGFQSYRATDSSHSTHRLTFTDGCSDSYRLAVTDLAFRYYVDSIRELHGFGDEAVSNWMMTRLHQRGSVFLRIGLARHWKEFPDRCHLQITAIHSFPDYLEGRCFADFLPDDRRPDRRPPPDLSNVPF